MSGQNFWQFSLVWFVLLFCSVSPVVMADNHQASFAQIRAAVFQLVDGEPASKQASIDFLEKQGGCYLVLCTNYAGNSR